MKLEDRLKKAEAKYQEHLDVCKKCEEAIYDETQFCTIAFYLRSNIEKIKVQINKSKMRG